MDSSVTPIDNRPRLIRSDVNYTQIVVDRTQALDGTAYDVMFVGTGGSWPRASRAPPCCGEPAVLYGRAAGTGLRGLWPCRSWPPSGGPGTVAEARTEGVRVVPVQPAEGLSRPAVGARPAMGARPGRGRHDRPWGLSASSEPGGGPALTCPRPLKGQHPRGPVGPGSQLSCNLLVPSLCTDLHCSRQWCVKPVFRKTVVLTQATRGRSAFASGFSFSTSKVQTASVSTCPVEGGS